MSSAEKTNPDSEAKPGGWSFYALIVNAIFGVGISAYLTYVHLKVTYASELVGGLCNISKTINCNVAAGSSYSEVGGIPVAILGGAFYLTVIVGAILWRLRPSSSVWTPRIFVFLFALSVLYSVLLGSIASFVLVSICWACFTLYAINIAGLIFSRILSGQGYVRSLREVVTNPFDLVRSGGTTVIMVVFLVATGISTVVVASIGNDMEASRKTRIVAAADTLLAKYDGLPKLSDELLMALEKAPSKGAPVSKDVPVVIVEFSDFECPFCGRVIPALERVLAEYPDQVRLHFLNFPLNTTCNKFSRRTLHPNACIAAQTALCADDGGKFWPMHDALFENHSSLSTPSVLKMGEEQGLDPGKLQACVGSETTRQRLSKQVALAKEAGVTGTPAIFINGRKVGGARPYEFFKKIIDHEIASQKAGASQD